MYCPFRPRSPDVQYAASSAIGIQPAEIVVENKAAADQTSFPLQHSAETQSPSDVLTSLGCISDLASVRDGSATDCGLSQHSSQPTNELPPFIKPRENNLDDTDEAYLVSKGALTLPDTASQTQLLQAYLDFTYPFLPVLDIQRLVRILDPNGGEDGQISLLLYQSMMFAGTAHVGIDCLVRLGFNSRQQARRKFFNIVKVCTICIPDCICLRHLTLLDSFCTRSIANVTNSTPFKRC